MEHHPRGYGIDNWKRSLVRWNMEDVGLDEVKVPRFKRVREKIRREYKVRFDWLESGNRLHFRYLSETMPLFRRDPSLHVAMHARSFQTSFDFLSLSLPPSTFNPFHPIGSQDPGWSWQIRQQNERDVSERCPARMRYANCIIARAA